jgi:hypothetical protein
MSIYSYHIVTLVSHISVLYGDVIKSMTYVLLGLVIHTIHRVIHRQQREQGFRCPGN